MPLREASTGYCPRREYWMSPVFTKYRPTCSWAQREVQFVQTKWSAAAAHLPEAEEAEDDFTLRLAAERRPTGAVHRLSTPWWVTDSWLSYRCGHPSVHLPAARSQGLRSLRLPHVFCDGPAS